MPPITVRFRRFTSLNTTIRLREGQIFVSLSDLLEGAPENVIRAISHILLAKLYKKPIEAAHNHRYKRFASSAAVTRPDSVIRPAAKKTAARPAKYTVKSGDTLSDIAKRVYHSPAYWPVLYWANHSQIKYANIIEVGQKLTVPAKPAKVPGAPSVLGPAAPAPVQSTVTTSAPVTYGQSAPVYSAPSQSASTYTGGGGFQSCVIARESGGNSQVMNSSGHYGLYQFSSGTWAAYGGNPASFGNASVSEQNQVFNNAVAAGGQSNWAPYDGC
jgi:LysM repeat protein